MPDMVKERIVVVEEGADLLRDAVVREALGDREPPTGFFIPEGASDRWAVAIILAQAGIGASDPRS